jgi:putative molybdopterin biosynthesis protein
MSMMMFTTKEVAEYLSINEKQVYRLIKERKIPSTRVTGKWLFPKELIDEWLISSARENIGAPPRQEHSANQIVIAGSNDLALELLTKIVTVQHPEFTVSLSNLGSLAGLIALQNGNCDVAASHLLDFETGEYNSSAIRKHFPSLKATVMNLAYREQGIIVQRENPLGIQNLKDLAGTKASFVNRQDGSGTRVLFDFKLQQEGIAPSEIQGYSRIARTHMEVGLEIFSGAADAGMGIQATAQLLGLGFIPVATERFDLIIPNERFTTAPLKAMREVLGSVEFKSGVSRMVGYNTQDTGRIMYERD